MNANWGKYKSVLNRGLAAFLVLLIALACFPVARAAGKSLRLRALFTDHMVMQRGAKAPVWGWAEPGTRVTVRTGATKRRATGNFLSLS